MNRFFTFFLTFSLFFSFKNTQAQTVLPKGAIPIVVRPPNHSIYKPAKINDSVEGHFLFDTGADRLSFDQTFYNTSFRNFGSSGFNYGEARVGGVGTGGIQTVPSILDTLDFKFGDHVYRTADISIRSMKAGHGDFYDGLLGHRYFSENNYVMEINYADEYMILHNDLSTVDLSGYTKINMEKQEVGINIKFYVPLIIQVNDTLTIQDTFLFDTGSGNAVYLSTTLTKKYNLHTLNMEKIRAVANHAGVSGRTTSVSFRANSVEIGGYKLNDVELAYSEDQSGSMASAHVAGGLLGSRILHHFDMVIDFGDSLALYLKPNRNFGIPFENISIYRGFGYADRSQTLKSWVVRGFFEGSPAEKSGMQSGDKIIFVNGTCVLEIPSEKQHDFWKNLTRVELVVLRNEEELKFEFELNSLARF